MSAQPIPRKTSRKSELVPRTNHAEDVLFYWGPAEPIMRKRIITRKLMHATQLPLDPPAHILCYPFASNQPPGVDKWSVFQVFAYFSKFFPDTAHVMLTARIDGGSLMALQRDDVLQMVHSDAGRPEATEPVAGIVDAPLDLATAQQMYAHVVRLQTRSNDARKSWNM